MACNGYPLPYHTQYVYYDTAKEQMMKLVEDELMRKLREIDPINHTYLFQRCRLYNIKAHQLRYMSERHIRHILPNSEVGLWAEFSFLHSEWKKKNFGSRDAATQTCDYDWLYPK